MTRVAKNGHEDFRYVVHEIDRVIPDDAEPRTIGANVAFDQLLEIGREFGESLACHGVIMRSPLGLERRYPKGAAYEDIGARCRLILHQEASAKA